MKFSKSEQRYTSKDNVDIKFEPGPNFDYNAYIESLGGRTVVDGKFVDKEGIDINNLDKEDNIYKKLKGYIIICRRTRSSSQEKAANHGLSKEFIQKNWEDFKKLISENSVEFIKNLSNRWIISILICFLDNTDPKESKHKGAILPIFVIINWHQIECELLNTVPEFRTRQKDDNFQWPEDTPWRDEDNNPIQTTRTEEFIEPFKKIRMGLTDTTKEYVIELYRRLFEDEDFILNRYNRFNAYDIKSNLISYLEDGIEHFCD